MQFVAMNRKVNIDLVPGVYEFNAASATGKTLLLKMVKSIGDKKKIAITYHDMLLGIDLLQMVHSFKPELLVLDRFDMYDENYNVLEYLKDTNAIVLVDYKTQRNFCDFDDVCFVTLTKDSLEVSL